MFLFISFTVFIISANINAVIGSCDPILGSTLDCDPFTTTYGDSEVCCYTMPNIATNPTIIPAYKIQGIYQTNPHENDTCSQITDCDPNAFNLYSPECTNCQVPVTTTNCPTNICSSSAENDDCHVSTVGHSHSGYTGTCQFDGACLYCDGTQTTSRSFGVFYLLILVDFVHNMIPMYSTEGGYDRDTYRHLHAS
eukprot:104490_1